jgi:hypothetical protein
MNDKARLTRDQDAAVLALREALARWLPLSQNPSIAEEWPDKYLDLVWGPNGDKANTYGQLRADLRLLSDHSAAAQQIEDEIRERVERQDAALCGAVLTCARPIGHYEYHERADGIQWLWPTGGGSVMGNEYVPLATQQPAEGGDS